MTTGIKDNLMWKIDIGSLDFLAEHRNLLEETRKELESLSGEMRNPEITISVRKSLLDRFTRTKKEMFDNHDYLVGRDWFIKFMSEFESDAINLLDDKSSQVIPESIIMLWHSMWFFDMYDDNNMVWKDFVEKNKMDIFAVLRKLSNFFEKISKKIILMLWNWLNNNFKNFPEPLKTYLMTEKTFVKEFLNNLWWWSKAIKKTVFYLTSWKKIDNLDSTIWKVPCGFDSLVSDFKHLFFRLKTEETESIDRDSLSKSTVSLDSISEQLALELSYRDGDLILDNLKSIDVQTAKELAKHIWWLSLNWLKTLNLDVAKELSSHLWWTLSLDWLESIDLSVVKELSSHLWSLSLMWLKDIDENLAKELVPIKSKILVSDDVMAEILYEESKM